MELKKSRIETETYFFIWQINHIWAVFIFLTSHTHAHTNLIRDITLIYIFHIFFSSVVRCKLLVFGSVYIGIVANHPSYYTHNIDGETIEMSTMTYEKTWLSIFCFSFNFNSFKCKYFERCQMETTGYLLHFSFYCQTAQ